MTARPDAKLAKGEKVILAMPFKPPSMLASAAITAIIFVGIAAWQGDGMVTALRSLPVLAILLLALFGIDRLLDRVLSERTPPSLLTNQRVIAADGRTIALAEIVAIMQKGRDIHVTGRAGGSNLVLRNLDDPKAFAAKIEENVP